MKKNLLPVLSLIFVFVAGGTSFYLYRVQQGLKEVSAGNIDQTSAQASPVADASNTTATPQPTTPAAVAKDVDAELKLMDAELDKVDQSDITGDSISDETLGL